VSLLKKPALETQFFAADVNTGKNFDVSQVPYINIIPLC
jgi:hypothetical protein